MPRIGQLGEYFKFVLETKGLIGFVLRIGTLVWRFDLTGKKMRQAVVQIDRIGKKCNYRPAIIIPALVLKRHYDLLNHLPRGHLELAIHGYTHRNFKALDLNEQVREIQQAKGIFEKLQVPACGFRAPYLSWNGHTSKAVERNDLLWESDETFIWNDFKNVPLSTLRRLMEHGVDVLYNPRDARKSVVIPRLQGKVVCIPIALPDDEMLVDRLGIKDPGEIGRIWTKILENTYQRGDIFVLQLHPERFAICREPMEMLLDKALHLKQDIWVTGMKEVAEWWKEKSQFRFTFEHIPEKGYVVRCKCADRATLVGRNLRGQASQAPFYRDYRIIKEREFFVESKNLKPCIGIHPRCSEMLSRFLADEGFPYEVSNHDLGYALFLSEYETFGQENELDLLGRIDESPNAIIRYWLWPDAQRSAFVTTHDLDCVTLTDFLLRLLGR